MRYVDATDLTLFATNTGELYKELCALAEVPDQYERTKKYRHLIHRAPDGVLARYCREVEPVNISVRVSQEVASRLEWHYREHRRDSLRLALAEAEHDYKTQGEAYPLHLSYATKASIDRIKKELESLT